MEDNQATLTNDHHKSVLRHLPSYEEATVPYSLRLPNYRSSYIGRFHPYPRYVTPPPECDSTDDRDEDVLDLSILDRRDRLPAVEREAVDETNNDNEQENVTEAGEDEVVVVNVEPVIGYNNGGEQIFITLDVKHSGGPSL